LHQCLVSRSSGSRDLIVSLMVRSPFAAPHPTLPSGSAIDCPFGPGNTTHRIMFERRSSVLFDAQGDEAQPTLSLEEEEDGFLSVLVRLFDTFSDHGDAAHLVLVYLDN
jgi:hypothetical protein